jgi:hypothetical protein
MDDPESWQRFARQEFSNAEWDHRAHVRMDRSLAVRHYSKELLFTARARAIFVDPDREPLPRFESGV